MVVIIVILVVAFLYWSLVPKQPKQPTFNDIINNAEKRQGNYSNVYKHKYTGMFYADTTPINTDDIKVFTGTQNECEIYVSKRIGNNF